jgi:hypothetical protein
MKVLSPLVQRYELKVKTKSKKVNKSWLNDHVNDPYVKMAKKDGYRARAAFKLKEIDEQLGLIKPGYLVVDLDPLPGLGAKMCVAAYHRGCCCWHLEWHHYCVGYLAYGAS